MDCLWNRPGKNEVFQLLSIIYHLVKNREAIINQPIQYMVKEKARTATHISVAYSLINMALIEKFSQRLQITRLMDSNHISLADEYIHLTGRGHPILLFIHRKMKHEKQMVRILVDFGTLNPAQNVVQIEKLKVEVLSQILHIFLGGLFN